MSGRRPEHTGPPELFYNEQEAEKYTRNSRIIEVQTQLTERAIQLLCLPDDVPSCILDVGCGSGLSGECLTDEDHVWIGYDISRPMLDVAIEREVEGDLIQGDMGDGLPFRPGMFDGVISISAIQWLCNADKKSHHPVKRMLKFFQSLYACMSRGARAALQFYPENDEQANLIKQQAEKAGFRGGLVVDYPKSAKARKIFLCLFTGDGTFQVPKGLDEEEERHCANATKREHAKKIRGKAPKLSRADWIQEKKERRKRQGKEVCNDSKYSGRRRTGKF